MDPSLLLSPLGKSFFLPLWVSQQGVRKTQRQREGQTASSKKNLGAGKGFRFGEREGVGERERGNLIQVNIIFDPD